MCVKKKKKLMPFFQPSSSARRKTPSGIFHSRDVNTGPQDAGVGRGRGGEIMLVVTFESLCSVT